MCYYISLLFLLISCKTQENIDDHDKDGLLSIDIIDTLTNMNSLFDIKEVIIDNYLGYISDFYIDKKRYVTVLNYEEDGNIITKVLKLKFKY